MCPKEGHNENCCLWGEITTTLRDLPLGLIDRLSVLPLAVIVMIAAIAMIPIMFVASPFEIIIWIGNKFVPEPKEDASHAHAS